MQDKLSKRPFPAADKISARIHTMALQAPYGICLLAANGTLKGEGDYIALAPPFNVTPDEIENMVNRIVRVIQDFFRSKMLSSA